MIQNITYDELILRIIILLRDGKRKEFKTLWKNFSLMIWPTYSRSFQKNTAAAFSAFNSR